MKHKWKQWLSLRVILVPFCTVCWELAHADNISFSQKAGLVQNLSDRISDSQAEADVSTFCSGRTRTSSTRRPWTQAMPDTSTASSRCSVRQSNTTHHPPAVPNVICPQHRTKAWSCSADWVDITLPLLPWKVVMTDRSQSYGLYELNGHFRGMAHRLRERYLCVDTKRQENRW